MTEIQKTLFLLRDEKYREFNASLIPTVDKESVIGVRTPEIRKLAKELIKSRSAEGFISSLPHRYFEENQLHAFIIAEIKDFSECIKAVDEFLPYIDNWATCDQLSPKCFKKNRERLLPYIDEWIKSGKAYAVRFAILCLMRYFLGEEYRDEYPVKVASVKSDEYYVKMAVAWYFATALSTNYGEVIKFISENRLDVWTHNKAIQKSIESYRITDVHKDELRLLKR